MRHCGWMCFVLAAALAGHGGAVAADLIVSAQDGKFVRVDGRATYPQPAPPDSLVVVDAEKSPAAIVATVEGLEHSVQGPPQAVAITPDGTLAIVAAPSRYDYEAKKEILDNILQVVDLTASPPRVERVDTGAHPNGLAISPDGKLLLAAMLDGTVRAFAIEGKRLTPTGQVKLGDKRMSGVAVTHDGRSALVARRDEGGIAVLAIDGTTVTDTQERVATGIGPYAIDVSSDGRWAVVGNTGASSAPTFSGKAFADAEVATLIDTGKRPFRAVQHLSVPSAPEGVAISPDGRWIVVQSMDGSNLTPDNPFRRKVGTLVLFRNDGGVATKVNEVPGGTAAQGVAFGKDNRTVLVQFDVERQLALYKVENDRLADTGQRIDLKAGPVSIRTMPR